MVLLGAAQGQPVTNLTESDGINAARVLILHCDAEQSVTFGVETITNESNNCINGVICDTKIQFSANGFYSNPHPQNNFQYTVVTMRENTVRLTRNCFSKIVQIVRVNQLAVSDFIAALKMICLRWFATCRK